MPKGNKPRISQEPSEERMVTWRISGDLHRLLTKVTRYLNMSHNRFVTEVMTVKLHEVNARIEAQKKQNETNERPEVPDQ